MTELKLSNFSNSVESDCRVVFIVGATQLDRYKLGQTESVRVGV